MINAMLDPAAIAERAEMAARAEFQPVAMMSGQEREQFEAMIKGLFMQADADGSGALDAKEFRACLETADLGFSKGDIQYLLESFDADGDKQISLDEFTSLSYDVLVNVARERSIMAAMASAGE